MPTSDARAWPVSRRSLIPLLCLVAAAMPARASDTWPFTPPEDAFSADALLDLRSLNERVAGESGFVGLSKDGNDFLLGNGKPARFWCVNASSEHLDDAGIAHQARFLAKRGVNMVRLHMGIQPKGGKVTDVDRAQVERTWKLVAAYKKEGIYTTVSPYWASCGIAGSWGIAGHSSGWGVLFCDALLQSGYTSWLRALYGEKNPYTGNALAQEPAVAVIQLQNEDSLLFWTMVEFLNQKGEPYDELRRGFAAFATRKYGDLAKAMQAWGGTGAPGDEPANGMLGFFQVWEITGNPGGARGERVADQLEYWARTMHDFDAAMEKFLRDELGCRQLVNAGNWRPADMAKQLDIERWSYTANAVTAVNRYITGAHVGPGASTGWAVAAGDRYTNLSITRDPTELAINAKQVVGHPHLVTESSWTTPDLYQSEGPLAIAAYSSLNGLDGFYWLVCASREWDPPLATGAGDRMFEWAVGTPMVLGQFPAAALMYRRNALKPGAVVLHEERALTDLWHERSPLIAENAGYDPNRDAQIPPTSSVKTTVDPLAFLIGRCEVVYGGDPAKSKVVDLAKYIDQAKRTVTSTTGEEKIDYGAGLLTVDAPRAQGAAGFLAKAGRVALGDVTISCANDYATVTVVAMDDEPIRQSAELLVQIGTIARPTGWKEHPDEFEVDASTHRRVSGFCIDAVGSDPWAIEQARGTVTIANPAIASATILDANGMATGPAQGSSAGGVYTLTLPPDALYVVLSAKTGAKATEAKRRDAKKAEAAPAKRP